MKNICYLILNIRQQLSKMESTTLPRCMICLEEQALSLKSSTSLECGHSFHHDCILDFINNTMASDQSYRCPLCRRKCIKIPRPLTNVKVIRNKKLLKRIEDGFMIKFFSFLVDTECLFNVPEKLIDRERPLTSCETVYNYKRKTFLVIQDLSSVSKRYRDYFQPIFQDYYESHYKNKLKTYEVKKSKIQDPQHIVLNKFFNWEKRNMGQRVRLTKEFEESQGLEQAEFTTFTVLGLSSNKLKELMGIYEVKTITPNTNWITESPLDFMNIFWRNIRNITNFQEIINELTTSNTIIRSEFPTKVRDMIIYISNKHHYNKDEIFRLCKLNCIEITNIYAGDCKEIFSLYGERFNLNILERIKLANMIEIMDGHGITTEIMRFIYDHNMELKVVKQFLRFICRISPKIMKSFLFFLEGNNLISESTLTDLWWLNSFSKNIGKLNGVSNEVSKILSILGLNEDVTFLEIDELFFRLNTNILRTISNKIESMKSDIKTAKELYDYLKKLVQLELTKYEEYCFWSIAKYFEKTEINELEKLKKSFVGLYDDFPVITSCIIQNKIKIDELDDFLIRISKFSSVCLSDILKRNFTRKEFFDYLDIIKKYPFICTILFTSLIKNKNYSVEQAKIIDSLIYPRFESSLTNVLQCLKKSYMCIPQIEELCNLFDMLDRRAWESAIDYIDFLYDDIYEIENGCNEFFTGLKRIIKYKPEHQDGAIKILMVCGLSFIVDMEEMNKNDTITEELKGRFYYIISNKEFQEDNMYNLYEMFSKIPSDSFLDIIEEYENFDSENVMDEIKMFYCGLKLSMD